MNIDGAPVSKIHPIPQSPLFEKASSFLELLKEDNSRIMELKSSGHDVSIETLDNNDEEEIKMELLVGVLEPKEIRPHDLDKTEMPPDTWRPATKE